MNYLQALVLAVVEGLTEFIPVSSTGHLILASRFINIPQNDFVKSFEIIIQLGAILAIVVLYGKTLLAQKQVWKRIGIAFLPTALLGFAFYKIIKTLLLGNEIITLFALFAGGFFLIVLEFIYKERDHHVDEVAKIPLLNAFLIGLFQSVSMIPGFSRSAATIAGGLLLGTKRKTAAEFSFLLAVPTMLAASGLELFKEGFSFTSYEFSLLAVGFVGSFIVAIAAVRFFLAFIQKHTFIPFGVYRMLLSILFWLFIL